MEVIDYIRENAGDSTLIEIFSQIDSLEFENRIIKAGADYYFLKPVDAKTVARRTEQLTKWTSFHLISAILFNLTVTSPQTVSLSL